MARSAPRSISNCVDRQAVIVELRHRMENCRLPADAGVIDCRAGIDVRATVEEQSGRCKVAVFRSHMQQRSSLKQEVAPAGLAAVELGKRLFTSAGSASISSARRSSRPRSSGSTPGTSYLVTPPASRRMSMQALSRCGERPYEAMT